MKCKFCEKIGINLSVSLLENQAIPEEFQHFTTILTLIQENKNSPDKIIQCPVCHSFYYQQRLVDNEIMHNSDDIEFLKISKKEALKIIAFQQKRLKCFSDSLDKKICSRQIKLTPEEKEILNIFKSKIKEELSIYDINLEYQAVSAKEVQAHLNSLIKKGILKQYNLFTIIYYKLL